MSLLKQILSPFVEFEGDKKKEAANEFKPVIMPPVNTSVPEIAEHPLITGVNSNITSTNTNPPVPTQPIAPRSYNVTPSLEHVRYFEKLIDDANATNAFFQGTDFKEFIDSKTDIDNISDEETRYKTAFNILKRTGLTKERLLATAQEYHNIIGRDLNAFQSAHMQKYQKEVKQREQLIQKKAEELRALSEKINALKNEISQLSGEMVDTKDKMNTARNSFLLAGENKQQEIQTELQKIDKYF